MTSETELREGLRRVADRLDAASGATDVTTVVTRRPPASPRPSRAVLAVAAAIALVVGLVAVLSLDRTDDESVQIESPTTATSPTTSTSTTTAAAEPTTTLEPTRPVPASWEGTPWEQLPARGTAVIEGERVVLFDEALTELGSFALADVPDLEGVEERRLLLRADTAPEVVSDIVEDGSCGVTAANGARVGACGPEQRTLVVYEPSGETVAVAEAPLETEGVDSSAGRWRTGQLSPDGRWVLAQWSAECEVPIAMLVPVDGGQVRTADGFTRWAVDDRPGPANSGAIGWTQDGRAIVRFPDGPACGSGDPEPGTYLVDPDTGERTPADRGADGFPWERLGHVNDRERAIDRAIAELGLEQCCGEPSHGGSGASTGVVWEGADVFIGGGDPGPVTIHRSSQGELTDVGTDEVEGLPVATAVADGAPLLAFSCGDAQWVVGGAVAYDDSASPTAEQLRAVAATLIPRLYCTVGEPPTFEQG